MAPPGPDEKPYTRLPDYFPTSVPKCDGPTEVFFKCFEAEARMKDETDVDSAPKALTTCHSELKGYMQCMEKHFSREGKPWWKQW